MRENILPIIILYNQHLYESKTYLSFLQSFDGKFVVYDNSPIPYSKKFDGRVIYYHDKCNGGVSAGYNFGCKIASDLGYIDMLLLLDQDTQFDNMYLERLKQSIRNFPEVDIHAPLVLYGNNKPFSPVRKGWFLKAKKISSQNLLLSDFILVNSGACIKLNKFIEVGGYNPNIRLDFADIDFFSRLASVSSCLRIVDSVAYQQFSNEETNRINLQNRYDFFLEGALSARKNPLIKTIVDICVLKHTIALTIRTCSLCFLKTYTNFYK